MKPLKKQMISSPSGVTVNMNSKVIENEAVLDQDQNGVQNEGVAEY